MFNLFSFHYNVDSHLYMYICIVLLLSLYSVRICNISGKHLTTHNIRYRIIDTILVIFLGAFLHTEAGWKRYDLLQGKEIINFLPCTMMEQKFGIQRRYLLFWYILLCKIHIFVLKIRTLGIKFYLVMISCWQLCNKVLWLFSEDF